MAPNKSEKTKESKDVWIVLLCGLPGSGKSTIRSKLVKKGWAYVSQDEMVTAEACEKALIKALKAGQSCVIDRCNVTPSERRLWMQHANRAVEKGVAKGITLHYEAVWMATSPEVCKERARARCSHETLSGEDADRVIDEFCKGLKIPERCGPEPYEAVLVVASKEDETMVEKRFANPASIDKSVLSVTKAASVAAVPTPPIALVREAPVELEDDDAEAEGGVVAGTSAEVFALRHGERADRARGRDDGWSDDVALTREGRETAKRAGSALCSLASLPCAAVYSSPFYRCLQTANEVAAELGLPVRVEPGLSELCSEKIFEQPPQLREPCAALSGACTRAEVDKSVAPVQRALPTWPERASDANARVVATATALAARHPGRSIVLVCHSHSVVEITRHLPSEGGGAASSTAGYCGLSHIAPNGGKLLRCLDQSYLKGVAAQNDGFRVDLRVPAEEDVVDGCWSENWQWTERDVTPISADMLFESTLDDVLLRYPRFAELFYRGSPAQCETWYKDWLDRDEKLRAKVEKAISAGFFDEC